MPFETRSRIMYWTSWFLVREGGGVSKEHPHLFWSSLCIATNCEYCTRNASCLSFACFKCKFWTRLAQLPFSDKRSLHNIVLLMSTVPLSHFRVERLQYIVIKVMNVLFLVAFLVKRNCYYSNDRGSIPSPTGFWLLSWATKTAPLYSQTCV